MSSFNNLLEFDNIRDESISSLKNISNKDISYDFYLNKSNNSKKIQNEIYSKYENKTEIFAAVFQWDGDDKNVYITGSFCNWLQFFEMRKFSDEENNFSNGANSKQYLILFLPRGTYQYKFKINSIWKCNSNFPTCSDKDGNINNVINIPPNKTEEGTTDFTTSHMTLQKFEETNNFYFSKNDFNSLDEFSYKYYFNYNLLSNQNKFATNNFLENKDKDILNGNYSFKKIYPISHEIINHFTIDKNNIKNDDTGQSLKYGCTYRYYKKLTTFIYYKPNKKENKDKK